MHAACHAATNLMFGSCTVLGSSSPVIEASKLVTVKMESQSQTPSLQLRHWLVDCARTMLTTFTILCTMTTMQLLGMWSSFSYHY